MEPWDTSTVDKVGMHRAVGTNIINVDDEATGM
jgi:hypothetical protein